MQAFTRNNQWPSPLSRRETTEGVPLTIGKIAEERPTASTALAGNDDPAPRPLRVLLVITRLTVGGDTNVVLDIADHLRRGGRIDVHLAAGPVPDHEVDLTRLAHERRIPTTIIPTLSNRLQLGLALAAVRQLVRLMRRGHYDIVHTHSSAAGVIGRTAAALAQVPVVLHHVHGWGLQDGQSRSMRLLYVALERMCARYTDRLIAVSNATIHKGLAHGIGPAGKFALVYNGVNLTSFRCSWDRTAVCERLGLDPGCLIVGMIGRLDRQKNPEDFIRAAAVVAREHPHVQFVIAGEGSLRRACEDLIDSLGLRRRFFLLGFRDDVPAILSILAVVVSSSLWEGLPIVFQEAMSASKPIVATDVDGARDVVIEGETGYLVPTHQPEMLAARVLSLLRNEHLRSEMGDRALKHSDRFSTAQMIAQIESLYTSLALSRPAGSR